MRLAAAAVLVALALVGTPRAGERWTSPVPSLRPVAVSPAAAVRTKGVAAGLWVYRRRATGVEQLPSGAWVRAGDLIQIGYRAGGAPYGVVVSVDGAGVVTLHHPDHPRGSTAVEPLGLQYLGHAFELDRAPRFERILFVTAARPIDVNGLLGRWRRQAPGLAPRLPAGLTLAGELLLRKGPGRVTQGQGLGVPGTMGAER